MHIYSHSTSVRFALFAWGVREPSASYNAGADSGQAQARVLVVEGRPRKRQAMAEQLQALGVKPVCVPDGLAACQAVAQRMPDLVLVSCRVRHGDGYETARRIRQWEARQRVLRPLPIVAVSASSSAVHWRHCMDSGIDGVLQEPLQAGELSATLQIWLRKLLPSHAEQDDGTPQICQTFEFIFAQDIRGFERAMNEGDLQQMAHFAHRLKGAASMLNAWLVAMLAERLEQAARGELQLGRGQVRQTLRYLKRVVRGCFARARQAHR
jgi:CheY-like chemotaxis protein